MVAKSVENEEAKTAQAVQGGGQPRAAGGGALAKFHARPHGTGPRAANSIPYAAARRKSARHRHPHPPPAEQPDPDGRSRRGQDRRGRGFAASRGGRTTSPLSLRNIEVRTLDLGLLQAGAGIKGEFENRLKSVIEEVKASPRPVILFIDEAHTLIGAGAQSGQGDAANLLKPALARGELRTIAATTWAEYKKYFEKDAALARRFQVVKVEEPGEESAVRMLRGITEKLEGHHKVRILTRPSSSRCIFPTATSAAANCPTRPSACWTRPAPAWASATPRCRRRSTTAAGESGTSTWKWRACGGKATTGANHDAA